MASCPVCNAPAQPEDGFCGICGAKLSQPGMPPPVPPPGPTGNLRCACGAENLPDARFCEVCGRPMTGVPSPPPSPTPTPIGQVPIAPLPPPIPPSRTGYLVCPDGSQIQITPTQQSIGRAHLSKFARSQEEGNWISRQHVTAYQEGSQFFVEDGNTPVQDHPSVNRTWLVRGATREEITGRGRRELQDGDELDLGEAVKLRFGVK